MNETSHTKNFKFPPSEMDKKRDKSSYIEELLRWNEEIRQARRAALNALEDAILSKEALRKSQEKYRLKLEQDVRDRTAELNEQKNFSEHIIDTTPEVILIFDIEEKKYTFASLQVIKLLGYSPAEIIEMGDKVLPNIIHPDDLPAQLKVISSLVRLNNYQVQEETFRVLDKQKQIRWVISRRSVFKRDESGKPIQLISILQDITDRKKAEQEILRLKDEAARKATDKYYSLFNSVHEGFCIQELMYDDNGQLVDVRIVEANPAYEKQTGLKRNDVVGRPHSELGLATEKHWFETYDRIAKTGKAETFENWDKPTGRWFRFSLSRLGGADSRQLAVVFNDITERKIREQQQEYLLKLSDALRPLSDPIEIQQTATKIIGEQLNVHRVFYGDMLDDEDTLVIGPGYANTVSPLEGFIKFTEFDSDIVRFFKTGRTIVINDIASSDFITSDHTKTLLADLRVIAAVAVPLLKQGKVKGILSVHQSRPRKWKPFEITLIEETAERTWAAVERAKAEEALRQSESKLAKDLAVTKKLQEVGSILIEAENSELLYEKIMDAAKFIMQSDFASIQVFVPEKNALKLVAQKDFHEKSSKYWEWVTADSSSVCGIALAGKKRIIVSNVEAEFRNDKAALEAFQLSGIRAVQSTPLISRFGKIVGILSTHWLKVHEPSDREFDLFDVVARQAADLIERKQAEDTLRQSEARFRRLSESDLLGVAFFATDGRIVDANDEFLKMLGAQKEDVQGKKIRWDDYTPQEWLPVTYKGIEEFKKTGRITPYEKQFRKKDGELRWGLFGGLKLTDESDTGVAMVIDITERKEAELKLKSFNEQLEKQVAERTADVIKQHSLLKQAEEMAQAGSWEYDVQTNALVWSDGMYRLFGMRQGEHVTPQVYVNYSLQEDLPIAKKIVSMIQQSWEPFEETVKIRCDGSYRTLMIKAAPLKNDDGKIEKMLGVDLDITAVQQKEEKILELNRSLFAMNKDLDSLNTELKTFAGIAANNYSETLRHLYINLEMIVTNDARNLSNSGRANLRRAQGAIQKMKLTTDDLISYSKLHDTGAMESDVDLNLILNKVIDDSRNRPGFPRISINCDQLPLVSGYPSLLSQLFRQLIDNAVKFRKEDSDHIINVTCKKSVNGIDIVNKASEKNLKYHVISIEDNGIGFPPAESEQIFTMFYRLHDKTKYKGSGTGLALAKRIVEMHGGFIAAEGVPDVGASFHCYFPAGGQSA